ncbi:MAG TPA: hypothetical protein VKB09_01145, partial [Thermomicrobiales bacterium]|nr:hypothetical protein [Thermomicrobiales bacterium]
MRAAIAWSHDLLTDDERLLFRHLSVFAGSFTLDAAEAVCGPQSTGDGRQMTGERVAVDRPLSTVNAVLDGVACLVDKSLIRREDEAEQPRFGMLETIREFAAEQRVAAGETTDLSRRHADYLLSLPREAEPRLYGPDQSRWFERLQHEHPNLRAALAWSIEQQDGETCLALAAAIWPFWFTRGYLSEGRSWLERALALPGAAFSRSWVEALHGLGALAHQVGDYQRTL